MSAWDDFLQNKNVASRSEVEKMIKMYWFGSVEPGAPVEVKIDDGGNGLRNMLTSAVFRQGELEQERLESDPYPEPPPYVTAEAWSESHRILTVWCFVF